MTNEITLANRAGVVIRETIYPRMVQNFYLMAKKPWLRYLGLGFDDAFGKGPDAMGSEDLRSRKVETMGVKNNQFKVIHNSYDFGGGVQAADEREALENGGYEALRSTASLRTIQGQFTITQQAMDALGEGNDDAFVNEIQQNTMGSRHKVQMEMNRQLMGDGNGILCYVDGATSSSTTVTVQTSLTQGGEKIATRHIRKNDKLWIGSAAQFVAGSGFTPVTVSEVTGNTTFTISAAASLTDEHLVVRQSVYSAGNSWYKELTGLNQMVATTGTIQTLNKASYSWWQSYVASIGGTMAVSDITTMINFCREFATQSEDLILVGNQKQWSRYESKLTTTKQIDYSLFNGKLAGGVQGLTFYSPDGQIPFFIDNDVPDGQIYCLDPNAYMLGYTKLLNYLDPIRSQTALEWITAFYMTAEHAQLNARSSGKLTGITG